MNAKESKIETLYVCKVVILRVADVPVAELHNLSCNPYIRATLSVDDPADLQHGAPKILTYRTHTCRSTLNPVFNTPWIVSGIPESGFLLSLCLFDEDPHNDDDNLGKTVIHIPWPDEPDAKFHVGWNSGEREYKVHKRKWSLLNKFLTCTAEVLTRGVIGHHVRLWISVQVLSKAKNQEDRRLYTVGPRRYVRHFSPLIGRLLDSSSSPVGALKPNLEHEVQVKPTAFVANRIQLAGPVPEVLRHRYVASTPFVNAIFHRKGIPGIVRHQALHKQYTTLYRWDANTVWGYIEDEDLPNDSGGLEENSDTRDEAMNHGITNDSHGEQEQGRTAQAAKKNESPLHGSIAFAKQFLRMTSHGTCGRIFTYVIMLDGEWRFTETGKQLAIEYLSKHTMHSDVEVEIAYSGEFFVQPLRRHCRHREPTSNDAAGDDVGSHLNANEDDVISEAVPAPSPNGRPEPEPDPIVPLDESNLPDDPALYELVIDNDSGTYRPRADLLPTLQAYLASPRNLGALGHVTCMNAFDEQLVRWKEEREKVKAAHGVWARGGRGVVSASSSTSSSAASGAPEDEPRVTKAEMRRVVEEAAQRARENNVRDLEAKKEQRQVEERQ